MADDDVSCGIEPTSVECNKFSCIIDSARSYVRDDRALANTLLVIDDLLVLLEHPPPHQELRAAENEVAGGADNQLAQFLLVVFLGVFLNALRNGDPVAQQDSERIRRYCSLEHLEHYRVRKIHLPDVY
jgi:hypothetical protein